MLVEGVFWCWLKGRFGGASLLIDRGGVFVHISDVYHDT